MFLPFSRFVKVFICVLAMIAYVTVYAENSGQAEGRDESVWHAGVGVDLASRYLWRGIMLSPGAVAQPYAEIAKGGFTFGVWGSSSLHAFTWHETDLYIKYDIRQFAFSLVDYYTFDETVNDPGFFGYKRNTTGHVIEAIVEFAGSENIPFRFLGGVNVYGADESNSLYFEAAWMKNLSEIDIEVFAGITPTVGYYHETKKGFTNVGLSMQKNLLPNSSFEFPLKISGVYNPFEKHIFVVAAIGIY